MSATDPRSFPPNLRRATATRSLDSDANPRIVRPLSIETAALLRQNLHEDFCEARNWRDLTQRLKNKGFYVKSSHGRTHLHAVHSDVQVCSFRFLGFPAAALEDRFSRTQH